MLVLLLNSIVLSLKDGVCDASTFSVSLGNTHCPSLAAKKAATSATECVEACCAEGDSCETWQWCEAGKACAEGFWAQPGSLWAGGDMTGWPQNTSLGVAEAACTANASCIGLTYHSAELNPGTNTTLKIYLKTAASGPVADSSWSRHIKASPGCFTGRLTGRCANATDGWRSFAMPPRPTGPCDILASAGTPCVAAHSVVRVLYANYSGALYRILRDSYKAGLDIGAHHNGFAKVSVSRRAFDRRKRSLDSLPASLLSGLGSDPGRTKTRSVREPLATLCASSTSRHAATISILRPPAARAATHCRLSMLRRSSSRSVETSCTAHTSRERWAVRCRDSKGGHAALPDLLMRVMEDVLWRVDL